MSIHTSVVQRPSTLQTTEPISQTTRIPMKQNGSSSSLFKILWPLSFPSTEEAAVARISTNFKVFGLYYLFFIYIVLFIALIPKRKVSLILLVIMKEITFLYVLLLRALPNSVFLHKIIDKRFVFFLLSIITGVELVLTGSAIHLLVTLASASPIVLAHSLLWKVEDGSGMAAAGNEEESSSLLPVITQNEP